MGLIKSIDTNYGIIATYWRISENTMVNPRSQTANITLTGYSDESLKDFQEIASRDFTLVSPQFSQFLDQAGDLRVGLYEFVKTQDEFSGATDA